MLVFQFAVMIFIFSYFICHIYHKLTVMHVTTLDAVIFFIEKLKNEKYYQPS